MKTLILILISFNSFAQVDTIQPPCNLTRQQTRLWHNLRETQLKLYDAQHKRENTREIKAMKYGLRSARVENKKIRDLFKFQKDSLKRSHALLMSQERNRSKEALKAERTEKKRVQAQLTIEKKEKKIAQTEADKKPSWNLLIGLVGGTALLFIVYIIIREIRRKSLT